MRANTVTPHYLVDFQGELTLDELYTRNRTREYTKRVPEEVIETAYNNHRELRENWRSILKNYRDVVAGYIAPDQVLPNSLPRCARSITTIK